MRKYRVECIKTILTCEGDAVFAGTPGTVIEWLNTMEDVVIVEWDYYLFTGVRDASDPPNTAAHLQWGTHVSNLRWTDK